MRHALFVLAAVALLIAMAGCGHLPLMCGTCKDSPQNCAACNGSDPGCRDPDGRCRRCRGRKCSTEPGVGAATVAYPYYTARGPRDFLARNPPSIGP